MQTTNSCLAANTQTNDQKSTVKLALTLSLSRQHLFPEDFIPSVSLFQGVKKNSNEKLPKHDTTATTHSVKSFVTLVPRRVRVRKALNIFIAFPRFSNVVVLPCRVTRENRRLLKAEEGKTRQLHHEYFIRFRIPRGSSVCVCVCVCVWCASSKLYCTSVENSLRKMRSSEPLALLCSRAMSYPSVELRGFMCGAWVFSSTPVWWPVLTCGKSLKTGECNKAVMGRFNSTCSERNIIKQKCHLKFSIFTLFNFC